MTNGRCSVMRLLRLPQITEPKEEKSLSVMHSLQIQHDRSMCNYSDLSISLKINSCE